MAGALLLKVHLSRLRHLSILLEGASKLPRATQSLLVRVALFFRTTMSGYGTVTFTVYSLDPVSLQPIWTSVSSLFHILFMLATCVLLLLAPGPGGATMILCLPFPSSHSSFAVSSLY